MRGISRWTALVLFDQRSSARHEFLELLFRNESTTCCPNNVCCLSKFITQSMSFLISATLSAVHDEFRAGKTCCRRWLKADLLSALSFPQPAEEIVVIYRQYT